MNDKIMKDVATLNAISDIASKLTNEDEMFERLSKVTKRMAELKMCRLSKDTILTILRVEGYINSEQLAQLFNIEV